MRHLTLALLSTALVLSPALSCAAKKTEPAAKGIQIVEVDERDPTMKAAFRKAQDTLDPFLKVAASKNPNVANAALRIVIRQGKKHEYFWIMPFEPTPTGFAGAINNAPRFVTSVQFGQPVDFKRSDVVDWMYVDNATNTMHGNYTACAQASKTPDDVKELKRRFGLDCSQ